MAFTYDLTTDAGRVRLLVPDSDAASYVFDDDEVDTFLALETGVKRAAALALETIAANQALTLKVIRLLDLSTDGARTSDALLKRADGLRKQADVDDLAVAGAAFDMAEMLIDDFQAREWLWNEAVRP